MFTDYILISNMLTYNINRNTYMMHMIPLQWQRVKSLLTVKEESEKSWFKTQHPKN